MIGRGPPLRAAVILAISCCLASSVGCISPMVEDSVPTFAECPQFLLDAQNHAEKNSRNDELLYYTG